MNFLDLCKRAWTECELAGAGPTSVIGQVGKHATIVNLVRDACSEIQEMHPNWDFLRRAETAYATLPAVSDYDMSYLSAYRTRWIQRIRARSASGKYRDLTLVRGQTRPTEFLELSEGTPNKVFLTNSNFVHLDAIPTVSEALRVDLYFFPNELTNNTDVPVIPVSFHPIIAYRAAMMHAIGEEDNALLRRASENYNTRLSQLEFTQLPRTTFAESELLE